MTNPKDSENKTSFAETAMRLGGKTEEEARRTGAVDAADDQVESLFAPQYKTVNSPVHKAVWENHVPLDLFMPPKMESDALNLPALKNSLEVLSKHKQAGTMF